MISSINMYILSSQWFTYVLLRAFEPIIQVNQEVEVIRLEIWSKYKWFLFEWHMANILLLFLFYYIFECILLTIRRSFKYKNSYVHSLRHANIFQLYICLIKSPKNIIGCRKNWIFNVWRWYLAIWLLISDSNANYMWSLAIVCLHLNIFSHVYWLNQIMIISLNEPRCQ